MEDRVHSRLVGNGTAGESLRTGSVNGDGQAAGPAGCSSCMSRRRFLALSASAAGTAAFLAACGDGQIGGAGVTDPTGSVTILVGDFPELATVNQLVLIDVRRAVKRTGATSFAAFSRSCTHQGTPVNLDGTGFLCPNHGSRFDGQGHVTLGPATRDLTVLTTAYDPVSDRLTIG
jgi:nitrite reductase/ring-hydroxylating ferredoxin subunit